MATESTQTHVSRQEGAPRKEAALTESSLLSELSVLRQEILREVRQDRDDISKKLHEIQEDQCLHKVCDMLVTCITVELMALQTHNHSHSFYQAQTTTILYSNGTTSVKRKQVCPSCMCLLHTNMQ